MFLDVLNAYDRANLNGYSYDLTLNGGRLGVNRFGEELLPRLPTIGANWDF